MARLLAAGATDVGLSRINNEDAYLSMPEAGLFALSDGMGGAAAGEFASGYFIETARTVFSNPIPASEEMIHELVQKVFRCSNQRIVEHVAGHPEDEGMGCTGDLLVFSENRYIVGHVGDSRVYLLRDRSLQQLTKDHSLVQLQVDRGMLTAEEARNHPRKNVILRAIGADPSNSCDMLSGLALDHDIFLLCSDGLTDMADDSTIQDILVSAGSIQCKTKSLIDAAISAGGRDNVTVVLCEVEV